MQAKHSNLVPILTIAGSDCSGGAGIQADLKTFSAHNLFGMSVVLSVVAENTARVLSSFDVPTQCVDEQFEAVFEDIPPRAVKIGMLGNADIIACVARNLQKWQPKNVVIDPVMFAKSGFALMPPQNCALFAQTMIRFADVLTPNIPEAQALCGFAIHDENDMQNAAIALHKMGAKNVLIKGGHRSENANDVFFDGDTMNVLKSERVETRNTHGTGCTLSSAIAANLALGKSALEAVREAKEYVFGAILHSLNLGRGHGPTNHFYRIFAPES